MQELRFLALGYYRLLDNIFILSDKQVKEEVSCPLD